MPSKSEPKFRIAVCGAGIGGLMLALVLGRYSDIEVDIFEAAVQMSVVGAGITVWPRTWRLMSQLGLDCELAKFCVTPPQEVPAPSFIFRRSDQVEEGYNFHETVSPFGSISIHRADIVSVLMAHLPKTCRIHYNKRMTTYIEDESGHVKLYFADGTNWDTDVLIGADGVKSTARATMYRSKATSCGDDGMHRYIEPIWTGVLAYRALISPNRLADIAPGHQALSLPLMYLGKNKHLIAYRISNGRHLNVVGLHTVEPEGTPYDMAWTRTMPKEQFRDHFCGWEPEVQSLVECVEDASQWAIHVLRPLPTYVSGRVALMGDAAHAMTTHFGTGAGQAIEDAYVLGRLLADGLTTTANIQVALDVYDAVRRPFVDEIIRGSRTTGFMYQFNYGPGCAYRCHNAAKPTDGETEAEPGCDVDEEETRRTLLADQGRAIDDMWIWQWKGSPEDHWKHAKRRLMEVVALDS